MKKIVFIGNSIVNGFPLKRSQCFVSLVRQNTGFNVINKGVNGETSQEILLRFEKDVLIHAPDFVFILTGTNDFIYTEASPREVFDNIAIMTDRAESKDIHPVLLTPLPVDAKMAARCWMADSNTDYDLVNTQLLNLSGLIRNSGRSFVDLNTDYKDCFLYHDGLHPSPEGHIFISKILINYLPHLTENAVK